MEELKSILSAMLPPLDDGQRRSLLTTVLVFFFAFHIAWACGYVPGLDGFARASAAEVSNRRIDAVMSTQEQILVRLMANDIENAREQQCKAIRAGNQMALEGWGLTLRNVLREYYDRSHQNYALRSCGEY